MCLNNQKRVVKSIRDGSSKPNPVSAKLCKNLCIKKNCSSLLLKTRKIEHGRAERHW